MKYLHQIGDRALGGNFNNRDEILACEEQLSFDGVYESVWQNRDVLAGKKGTILFVSGSYIGRTNAFDLSQPVSKFVNDAKLQRLCEAYGIKLGWHGWEHRDCTTLDPIALQAELEPPDWWGDSPYTLPILAWPYGSYNATAVEIAKRLGYIKAYTTPDKYEKYGDFGDFSIVRTPLNW